MIDFEFYELCNGAIDFHCHGIGRFDFTDIKSINLDEIEAILANRGQNTILTLYLPKPNFNLFLSFMDNFQKEKELGKVPHISGIGLEGPLLASHGGTPESGVWFPEMKHWKSLSECGKKGLVYIILSPDFTLPESNFYNQKNSLSLEWIIETLLEGGVLPAPGHFVKSNPNKSAELLQILFNIVKNWGQGCTITDHLYNDMPRNFKHAWRTESEKVKKIDEIKSLDMNNWHIDNLEKYLGIVPATIINNAKNGLVKICQNFDGEHVDLEIVKKTVALVGSKNLLMMTDSIESKILSGKKLIMNPNSTLLYQQDGIVAAGSQNVSKQIQNMADIGLSSQEIQACR